MSVYSFDIIFTCFLNWILCEKRAYPTSFCIREIRNVATKNAVRISLNEICEKAEKKMVEIKTTTAYGLWHIGQRKLHKRAHISDSIGCATTVQFRRLLWSWAFRIASSNSNQFIEPYCKLNAKKKLHLLASANSIRTWNLITLLLFIRMNSFSQHQHIIRLIRSLEKRLIWFFPHS